MLDEEESEDATYCCVGFLLWDIAALRLFLVLFYSYLICIISTVNPTF